LQSDQYLERIFAMKKGMKFAAIALLFLAGTGSALAGPFARGFGSQGMRGARQPRMAQQDRPILPPTGPRGAVPPAPAGDPREGAGIAGNAGGAGIGNLSNAPPDQPRRMGQRLTIEERRALRRQINDAGHDIYTSKK
jgi:hypothetical protein